MSLSLTLSLTLSLSLHPTSLVLLLRDSTSGSVSRQSSRRARERHTHADRLCGREHDVLVLLVLVLVLQNLEASRWRRARPIGRRDRGPRRVRRGRARGLGCARVVACAAAAVEQTRHRVQDQGRGAQQDEHDREGHHHLLAHSWVRATVQYSMWVAGSVQMHQCVGACYEYCRTVRVHDGYCM